MVRTGSISVALFATERTVSVRTRLLKHLLRGCESEGSESGPQSDTPREATLAHCQARSSNRQQSFLFAIRFVAVRRSWCADEVVKLIRNSMPAQDKSDYRIGAVIQTIAGVDKHDSSQEPCSRAKVLIDSFQPPSRHERIKVLPDVAVVCIAFGIKGLITAMLESTIACTLLISAQTTAVPFSLLLCT